MGHDRIRVCLVIGARAILGLAVIYIKLKFLYRFFKKE